MRQKISLIRQKSLFTRHMDQTDLLKITQTRHCAGKNRRQSREKPMLSSTGWNTPEKGGGSYRMRNTPFRIFGGGQTTSERREDVPCGNGRRSSELREESSSRKPEIALPPAGKLRRPTLPRAPGFVRRHPAATGHPNGCQANQPESLFPHGTHGASLKRRVVIYYANVGRIKTQTATI